LVVLGARPAGVTRFQWLWNELRRLITNGVLAKGIVLPSTRRLAATYGVARGTVVQVYEQLVSEGYLEGKTGSGTRVAFEGAERLRPWSARASGYSAAAQQRRVVSPELFNWANSLVSKVATFAPHQVATDLFPADIWARVASRSIRKAPAAYYGHGDAAGFKPLRIAIAEYLGSARGVRCHVDQIMVGSGTQLILAVVSQLLLRPGDSVWMEEPGYAGARAAFEKSGAKICPVSVDREGLDVRAARSRYPDARLAYVTPAHQWPLGVTMSISRRVELLRWAADVGAYIFEDDYDSEFRFRGHPLSSLQGLEGGTRVIYCGSFNKMLFPSIRLGYAVLPEKLVEPFLAARSLIDRYPPVLDQAILTEFIDTGEFGRHIRRMRLIYAERRAALLEAGAREFSGLMTVADNPAGLQAPAWLKVAADEALISKKAAGRGMQLVPLSRYYQRKPNRSGFLLGFSGSSPIAIARGCKDLAEILHDTI
jgi:GntR family transcriptional regulator/MocR family aminotransferase